MMAWYQLLWYTYEGGFYVGSFCAPCAMIRRLYLEFVVVAAGNYNVVDLFRR